MKYLKNFLIIIVITLFSAQSSAQTYKVQNKVSKIEWVGKKVTGSHEGTIDVSNGFVEMNDDKIKSGQLKIDMTTIQITDIEDEKMNEKFKGHLNSSDFFDVKNYNYSTLIIEEVTYNSATEVDLICNLTIKEYSNKIKVPAKVLLEEGKLVVIGEVEIDRTKFDIKYGSGSFVDNLGDKAINNNFEIKFKIAAQQLK